MRILLLEDDPATAELIIAHFSVMPHWKVYPFSTLKEGLKSFEEEVRDIVILDLGLPGSTVAGAIAAIPRFSATSAVVIMTGHIDDVIRQKCIAAGAHAFLSKDVLKNGQSLVTAISLAWDQFSPKEKGEKIRNEINLLREELNGLNTILGELVTGQKEIKTTLKEQNLVLKKHTDSLEDGRQKMDDIKTDTSKTNGRVNKIEPMVYATDKDVKVIMDERRDRIVAEQTEKLRKDGYLVLPRKIGQWVIWFAKQTKVVTEYGLKTAGLIWLAYQLIFKHNIASLFGN